MSISNLNELVASRICHDLISPVGAIANGVELMALGGSGSEEISLISESAQSAGARVRFFRIAFGAAGAEQMVDPSEVKNLFSDLAGDRVSVNWRVEHRLTRQELRAGFLALLCLEKALPLGGTITVLKNGRWRFEAAGQRVTLDKTLWTPLAKGQLPEDVDPSSVSFALLPDALTELGKRISVETHEKRISLSF
jgi:histidine phosphotransferase ChpT